ncbi:sigma factor-like helix-turn-helix DNA-binding protein [Nocardioides sp. CN2-186]|uniref:sigma factor-like helix-turn-helix DNA-binding protein n=1 Tax=Nocardioides tweenelious TaxID=3156607 RepID=UPI0032B47BB0
MSEEPSPLHHLVEAIRELPEQLRLVVEGYFVERRSVAELAAELGATVAQVVQLRAEALVRLRDAVVPPPAGKVPRRRGIRTARPRRRCVGRPGRRTQPHE